MNPKEVGLIAQLASCLEVSGTPKPGNIHRQRDFPETTYEQFLAGSIAIGIEVENCTKRAIYASKGKIEVSSIGIGLRLLKAIQRIKSMHKGGNTHLGTLLLFLPISAGVGLMIGKEGYLRIKIVRKYVGICTKATSVKDAVFAYKAILEANMGGLGELSKEGPSVSEEGIKEVKRKSITLYEAMRVSSDWDNIAKEWTNNFEISFNIGYPTFMKIVNETKNVNIATVHTFLEILSKEPDTFIARKVGAKLGIKDAKEAVNVGLNEAKKVSEMAKEAIELGGLKTKKGKMKIKEMDSILYSKRLNPGTTADLTASSIMLALLSGFRP